MRLIPLLTGFPGKLSRGWLGWSSVTLLKIQGQNILFDTGSYNDRPALLQKLKSLALSVEDIKGIILSHLHFDHASNMELFPEAWVAIHQRELTNSLADLAAPYYITEGVRKHPRLRFIKQDDEPVPGCRIMETPGHTQGSISLFCELGGTRYMMVGDAVKNLYELNSGLVQGAWDREKAARTIAMIREKAAIIIPGHDGYLNLSESKGKRLNSPSEWVQIAGSRHRYLLEAGNEVR